MSPAHENAKLSTTACQYQIIYWSAYQYQIIQFYPKQSSTDVQGKPFIKMQKIKHAASKGSFPRAASGKYIKKKISPEWKNEHEESYANDGSQRGSTWN